MSVERYGPFIEFRGENGIRYVARVNAVAIAFDVDEMEAETNVIIAGHCILVSTPLDELRQALLHDGLSSSRARS